MKRPIALAVLFAAFSLLSPAQTVPAPVPIAEQTAEQIIASEPTDRTPPKLLAFFKEEARAARIKSLAEAALAKAISGEKLSIPESTIIARYHQWVDPYEASTNATALAYLKLSYPLTPSRASRVLKFVRTPEQYEAVKAAGFVVEGTPLLPDAKPCVMGLACRFEDFEFVDTFARAGAISQPLSAKNYMKFLQWKLVRIPDDKGRYEFLQNELTNLMLSNIDDPNNNQFAVVINKASDLIYLRLRRAQALETPAP